MVGTAQARLCPPYELTPGQLRTDTGAVVVVEEARAAAFVPPQGFEGLDDDTEFVFLRNPLGGQSQRVARMRAR
jgi:hypothetical protein